MLEYNLTKVELELLTKQIYEEACCGYLDLKDSVCERVVGEFLGDKKPIEHPAYAPAQSSINTGCAGGGGAYTGTTSHVPVTWSAGTAGTAYIGTPGSSSYTSYTYSTNTTDVVLNSNDVVLRDNTIDLRSTGF